MSNVFDILAAASRTDLRNVDENDNSLTNQPINGMFILCIYIYHYYSFNIELCITFYIITIRRMRGQDTNMPRCSSGSTMPIRILCYFVLCCLSKSSNYFIIAFTVIALSIPKIEI